MKVAKYALESCIGELQAPSQILILHPFQYCKSHFLRFFPHSFFTAMSGKLAILVTKKSSKFFCLGQDPGLPTVAAESGYRFQPLTRPYPMLRYVRLAIAASLCSNNTMGLKKFQKRICKSNIMIIFFARNVSII